MLMMLEVLGKKRGGNGENAGRLMLMMLAAWGKPPAADAHDAGGFGDAHGSSGVNAGRLMLMMFPALGKLQQLMLMMLEALGTSAAAVG